jgi:hypothetical protein
MTVADGDIRALAMAIHDDVRELGRSFAATKIGMSTQSKATVAEYL